MKALVTGASGFTGSHLVQALVDRGDEVIAYIRSSSNVEKLKTLSVPLVYGDITDEAALTQAMAGVDTVFHTAAYVELGLVDERRMEQVNIQRRHGLQKLPKWSTAARSGYTVTPRDKSLMKPFSVPKKIFPLPTIAPNI
jgi:dihydroflavonol-4-reductase